MSNIGQVTFNTATNTFSVNFVVEHAYIFLVTILTFIVHQYLGGRVIGAREKYNVKLPHLYEAADEKGDEKSPFNRYQRGHMNFVENLSLFLALLYITGLFYPVYASILGAIGLVGRVLYATGYTSAAGPSGRYRGVLGILTFFISFFQLIYITYRMFTIA